MAASTVRSETALQWQMYTALGPAANVAGDVGDTRCDQIGSNRDGDRAASREAVANPDRLGVYVVVPD
jgi:hypothetical protein